MKIQKLLVQCGLALCCVILMGGCFSSPSPSDVEKALRDQIDSESGGQIKLVSFKKTDGQKFEAEGIQGYKMDYEAGIEFGADGIWFGRDIENYSHSGLTFSFHSGQSSSNSFEHMAGGLAVHRGNQVKITGVMTWEKKESGWKFETGDSHLNAGAAGAILQANACINTLRQIDRAAKQWALEKGKRVGDPVDFPDDLTPYVLLTADGKIPSCPNGGVYTINKVGDTPTCSLGTTVTPKHVLP